MEGTGIKNKALAAILAVAVLAVMLLMAAFSEKAHADEIKVGGVTLSYEKNDGATVSITGCDGSGSLAIPAKIEGLPVTSIGEAAFYDCSFLTSVTIPSSVTSIGNSAFYDCSSLTSVTIPSSVKKIDDYTFYWCKSLTSVTIPSSVTSIGYGAFYGCHSLESVTIPSSVTSIEALAFCECSSLASVTIPSSVTSIEDYAFQSCRSLEKITIPPSVMSIGDRAFYKCSSLKSASIPSSVASIGEKAFYQCSSLKSITIPSSVTSIGQEAFEDCMLLRRITILASVTSIGDRTFYNCPILEAVALPASLEYVGDGAFAYDSAMYDPRAVADVYYAGSKSMWKAISFGPDVSGLKGARIHYNAKGILEANPKGAVLKAPIAGKKAVTVKWKKQSGKVGDLRIDGYQVRYSAKASMKSAKVKAVKGYKKTSLKVSKLMANTKYYVQVRTYLKANGTTYYSAWSKAKSVKTR